MKASLNTSGVTNELTITLQGLKWDEIAQASFYAGEVQGRDLLKLIGQELTMRRLRTKAVEAPTRERAGKTSYRKDASPGHYQRLDGAVVLSRPL